MIDTKKAQIKRQVCIQNIIKLVLKLFEFVNSLKVFLMWLDVIWLVLLVKVEPTSTRTSLSDFSKAFV